ncbi:hypothetical protein [Paenibacillus marinisediminis]
MSLLFLLMICLAISVNLSLLATSRSRSLTDVLLLSVLLVLTGGFLLLDRSIGDNDIFMVINYGLIFTGLMTGILSFILKKG